MQRKNPVRIGFSVICIFLPAPWRSWRLARICGRSGAPPCLRASVVNRSATLAAMGPILPGSAVGVLGSGQLGRMFAIAARQMGYRVHTYSPDSDTPTGQVADVEVTAPYEDLDARARVRARREGGHVRVRKRARPHRGGGGRIGAGQARRRSASHDAAAVAREDVSLATRVSRHGISSRAVGRRPSHGACASWACRRC